MPEIACERASQLSVLVLSHRLLETSHCQFYLGVYHPHCLPSCLHCQPSQIWLNCILPLLNESYLRNGQHKRDTLPFLLPPSFYFPLKAENNSLLWEVPFPPTFGGRRKSLPLGNLGYINLGTFKIYYPKLRLFSVFTDWAPKAYISSSHQFFTNLLFLCLL